MASGSAATPVLQLTMCTRQLDSGPSGDGASRRQPFTHTDNKRQPRTICSPCSSTHWNNPNVLGKAGCVHNVQPRRHSHGEWDTNQIILGKCVTRWPRHPRLSSCRGCTTVLPVGAPSSAMTTFSQLLRRGGAQPPAMQSSPSHSFLPAYACIVQWQHQHAHLQQENHLEPCGRAVLKISRIC